MSEQVVPSTVAQSIIVKFLISENLKPAEILTRLSERSSVITHSQAHRCMTGVIHLKEARQVENMRRLYYDQGFL
jgi:hypothetical protein